MLTSPLAVWLCFMAVGFAALGSWVGFGALGAVAIVIEFLVRRSAV